jgi:riboflavin kinase/FMN adenylyltransferase
MDALPEFRRPVVTVGSFDGVHRGHRFLLDIVCERAVRAGGESVVVTFGEHPRRVVEAGAELRELTPAAQKAALIAEAGIDDLVVMPFTPEVSRMTAEEFVRDFLVGRLGVCELVVGYNHRLGRGREGDAEILGELGARYGFGVFRAPTFEGEGSAGAGGCGDEKISSTAIRNAISKGDIETAERMLGRRIN